MYNRSILITGASGEIGTAVVEAVEQQAKVIGLHGNTRSYNQKNNDYKNKYINIQSNLTNQEECFNVVDKFVDETGEINGLVQAHGNISRSCSWQESNNKDWLNDLNVNLISSFFLAQRAIFHMRDKGGSIVMMSTASATRGGGSNSLPYGVSKYGVRCIVKRLARDSGKYGIRINAVAPGYIQTEFHKKQIHNNKENINNRKKNIPLNKLGTTQNVADVISNLLLDDKSFITGQIITIDGGDFI